MNRFNSSRPSLSPKNRSAGTDSELAPSKDSESPKIFRLWSRTEEKRFISSSQRERIKATVKRIYDNHVDRVLVSAFRQIIICNSTN